MSTERYPRKAVIAAPDGLTPKLKTKSRARRERQRTLAGIADHAPKRRNDLLPKLAVSYVPIDELRQAPRRVRRAERRASRADSRQHRKVRRLPADPYQ